MTRQEKLALGAAALGNGIFGFSFMFSRIALGVAQPFVMLMYRFVITFVLLLFVAAWASRRKPKPREDGGIDWLRFDLRGRKLLPLIGLGLVQPVGYFLCESYGISMTNATFSGVMIAMVPIAGMVSGALTLGEIPNIKQIAYSLLSIAGVVVMTMQQSADGQILPLGVVLLIGAVVTGAFFNTISRKVSGEYSVLERTVVMMGVAAVTFTTLAVVQTGGDAAQLLAPMHSPAFLGALGYLALCSSIVAFMALNFANNYLPVARTTAFANLTTVISLFAGVIFLGEPFGVVSLIASVMILTGIWGVQRS